MNIFKKYREKRLKRKREALYHAHSLQVALSLQMSSAAASLHGVGNTKPHSIILSLTSFPGRIHDVYLTVESLFQQSLKADKVILWLSKEDFPGEWDELPETLINQCERGLEIVFVDGNIGPYKKIIYALKNFPEALIITVDDDILYPIDTVDLLYKSYLKQPDVIHCHRGHRVKFDRQGDVLPYKQWDMGLMASDASFDVFPTGNGGVLYFPGALHSDVTDEAAFQRLAHNADDIWLKAMSLKVKTPCKVISHKKHWRARLLMIDGSQEVALTKQNKIQQSGNDFKLKSVFDFFDLWDQLKADDNG